jgi:NCS2 family nucleobase:cation symporter-2
VLGTIGLNTSTSNVGLASATGITSRYVAFAVGGIYLTLAFLPKAGTVFAIMPAPVVGATLLFVSALVFVNGIIIITSRMLDSRRIFVIGLSFMLALAADVYQPFFSQLPAGVRVFTSSSIVLGTLAALLLNLLFRLGVRRTQTLLVNPLAVDAQQVEAFMETHGGAWGARRDVIERARFNLMQSIELLADSGVTKNTMTVSASFDEFSLDVSVSYAGVPLELPERRPSNEEIIGSYEGQYDMKRCLPIRSASPAPKNHLRRGRGARRFAPIGKCAAFHPSQASPLPVAWAADHLSPNARRTSCRFRIRRH